MMPAIRDKKANEKSFKKGSSGNPQGRPKRTAQELDLIAACKEKTPRALAVMVRIMEEGENERNQLAAAQAIIDRGYGKAVQPSTVSAPDGGPITHSLSVSFVPPKRYKAE